jgi:hypothetical protein
MLRWTTQQVVSAWSTEQRHNSLTLVKESNALDHSWFISDRFQESCDTVASTIRSP